MPAQSVFPVIKVKTDEEDSDVEIHIPESDEEDTVHVDTSEQSEPPLSNVIEIKLPENSKVTPLVKIPMIRSPDGQRQPLKASFQPTPGSVGQRSVKVVMTELGGPSTPGRKSTPLTVSQQSVGSSPNRTKSAEVMASLKPVTASTGTPRVIKITRPVVKVEAAASTSVTSQPDVVNRNERVLTAGAANTEVTQAITKEPTKLVKSPQPRKGIQSKTDKYHFI